MAAFVRIGDRYINLENVAEVRVNAHMRTAYVFFAGGGTSEFRDDDTSDLMAALEERATVPEASHRKVFVPIGP